MLVKRLVREFWQWPLLVVLAMSILLALVIPPSWVTTIPGVGALLQSVAESIPAIGDYVTHSKFPEVASVYFPTMLLVSPLLFVWTWRTMPATFWKAEFTSKPLRGTLRLLAALLLTLLVGFATYVEGGGQLKIIPWNESRIALALAGYIASGGAFFIAVATVSRGLVALIKRIGEKHG